MLLRLQALQGRIRKDKSVMKAKGKVADLYTLVGITVHPLDVSIIYRDHKLYWGTYKQQDLDFWRCTLHADRYIKEQNPRTFPLPAEEVSSEINTVFNRSHYNCF